MADGIGRIFGGGNYGVGGYVPQRKNEDQVDAQQSQAQPQANREDMQVDPDRVMELLAQGNFDFRPVVEEKSVTVAPVDAETEDRIANYMEKFELIYAEFVDIFGEQNAADAMNIAMDKLLGMVA